MPSKSRKKNKVDTGCIDRVFKFGCLSPDNEALALQLLGQASNYREDLRRVYNDYRRWFLSHYEGNKEATHVCLFEKQESNDEDAHVRVYEKDSSSAYIAEQLLSRVREARSKRGHLLDAGTYWLVEDTIAVAHSRTDFYKMISAPDPFDWTGSIGAEIQARAKFPAAAFQGSRVHLVPNQDSKDPGLYYLLTIQVGAKKEKHFLTFPLKLHRPFPANAIVNKVTVQRCRTGHRYYWEALISISFKKPERDLDAVGVVGVDIGWRAEAGGKRVATFNGADTVGVLRIDTLTSFEYSDSIQGFRDTNFDLVKDYVAGIELPGTESVKLWKSKSRMHRLALRNPELGICLWRERDKHLEDIESGVRSKAMRRRLNTYRVFADMLARKYKYVALEDMPMADWVGEGETHARERNRSVAALYILQLVIAQRFGADRTDWVPAEFTSMTCSHCGEIRAETVGPAPYWQCECGAVHHQDENAAIIIRRDSEGWIGGGNSIRPRTRKAVKKPKKKEEREELPLAA